MVLVWHIQWLFAIGNAITVAHLYSAYKDRRLLIALATDR